MNTQARRDAAARYAKTEKGRAKKREVMRRYYERHREERKAYARDYHKKNSKKVYQKSKARRSRVGRRYDVYGVSLERFQEMLMAQGGCCAICGTTHPGTKGWMLDHDHQHTPRDAAGHRGILCGKCNAGIGMLDDSLPKLLLAVKYLRKWGRARERHVAK